MKTKAQNKNFLCEKARQIRKKTFLMVSGAKSGHLGGAFSCIDILTVLYFKILNINPKKPLDKNRDRFILSKGHSCSGLYVTLAVRGFLKAKTLDTYLKNGSILGAHPSSLKVPGLECLTGSLGHGLSMGAGMALAAKHDKKKYKVYVLISDGECDEGATWECALFASHFKLDNLVVILDYNKFQAFGKNKEVMNLEPLKEKWVAFGFSVQEVNGHDHLKLYNVLRKCPFKKNKPSLIIAHTVKGKGVSFMENTVEWHYLTPNEQQRKIALRELNQRI